MSVEQQTIIVKPLVQTPLDRMFVPAQMVLNSWGMEPVEVRILIECLTRRLQQKHTFVRMPPLTREIVFIMC